MITALALAATCSWNTPGADPYVGAFDAAIDAYKAAIPADARAALKRKIDARQYDDVAEITRDAITGDAHAYDDLRMMHFGARGRVCATVDRSQWGAKQVERGLVYCAAEHCVIIPTVCRNVSIVTRAATRAMPLAPDAPATGDSFEGLAAAPGAPAALSLLDAPPESFGASAGFGSAAASSWGGASFGAPLPQWAGYAPGVSPVAAVPEPGTWALMLLGLAGVALARRRGRK